MACIDRPPPLSCFQSSSSSAAVRQLVHPCNTLLVHACSSTSSTSTSSAFYPIPRRLSLVQIFAYPLVLHTQNCHSSAPEDFMDPTEQALVETLDARDSLAELCKDIKSITQGHVSHEDLQNQRRALGKIYESLEISLPKVAEQFELEEFTVQELLESVACANDVFIRSCYTINPSSGLHNCSKFLQLACIQMDEMLEQVPTKTLETVQFLRGIRPGA